MTLIARPVVKNKFWIVEQEGEKVATIQKNHNNIVWVDNQSRKNFPNLDLLKNTYNLKFVKITPHVARPDHMAYGYPCDQLPYNTVWDIKNRVPLYSKSKKSRCYYAAGYYVMDGEIVFCPKSIFINRTEFVGPFKTREAAEQYSNEQTQSNTQFS